MNEDESEYAVKAARDLRVGDEIVAMATNREAARLGYWRSYRHVVTEATCLCPVGAAASYVYSVRVPRQQPAAWRTPPWAAYDAVAANAAKEERIAQVNGEWKREYLGQRTEPLDRDDLLPDDVKVTVKPVKRVAPSQATEPKIDGIAVTLLQDMYLDRQHDRPLKGLLVGWRPTPAQRQYLQAWWSDQVRKSTAAPEPLRASDVRNRAPHATVLVDNSDP
jgi:hypothetical protein